MSFYTVMLLGVINVVIHELGHITAAYAVGTKIKRVGVNWRGVYVVRAKADTLAHNLLIAFAGPGINLLTAVVLYALHQPYFWIALWIGAYNLVPVPYSDMSRAIQYWKESRQHVSTKATAEAAHYQQA